MRFPTLARSCRACALALFAATAGAALSQTVQFVTVGRHIDYVQTSATDVQVKPRPRPRQPHRRQWYVLRHLRMIRSGVFW